MDEEISTAAEVAEGAALRFGRAVHSDPDAATTPEQEPLPVGVQKKPVEEKSPAEWAYERIILYIQNFEKTLDNQHEVAMGFTDTGAGVLKIEGLGYFDLLRASRKPEAAEEPRRIGFELARALDDEG